MNFPSLTYFLLLNVTYIALFVTDKPRKKYRTYSGIIRVTVDNLSTLVTKKGVYLLQNKSIGLQIVKLFEPIGLLLPDQDVEFHL
jgi:hypothetical protein